MIKIGVDALGGDNAPKVVVRGAIEALGYLGDSCRIVLFGNKDSILKEIHDSNCNPELFDIVHTSECIEMSDHPTESFLTKKDSSIVVGFDYLATGKIDGFASAGSTGAMMVGSMMVAKPLPGVLRPTIAIAIPTLNGSPVVILDIGINVDCKAEVLEQYALIGSAYAECVLGIESPRVALLNIGEESSKGNTQTKAAYKLMEHSAQLQKYNFVGNIEPSHIFTGQTADVVVCDGFVGNTILKLTEGFYAINAATKLTSTFWEALNYEKLGGTTVLGIGSVVTIAHGKSTSSAISNMIRSTKHSIETGLIERLKSELSNNSL